MTVTVCFKMHSFIKLLADHYILSLDHKCSTRLFLSKFSAFHASKSTNKHQK